MSETRLTIFVVVYSFFFLKKKTFMDRVFEESLIELFVFIRSSFRCLNASALPA
jgi:hypothetical protein